MQRIITVLCMFIVLISCGKTIKTSPSENSTDTISSSLPMWVQELKQQNPLVNYSNMETFISKLNNHNF